MISLDPEVVLTYLGLPIVGGALGVLTLAHMVVALRLLTHNLEAGVVALFAPLPLVLSAFATPLVIAGYFAVMVGERFLRVAGDVATGDVGLMAWVSAMGACLIPVGLSLVAHVGVTPPRRLDEAELTSDP